MRRNSLGLLSRVALRSKDGKKILKEFNKKYGTEITGKNIEKATINGRTIYFIDEKPLILEADCVFIPTLIYTSIFNRLPSITIDMGAIPFLCKGADVMIPGIRDAPLPLRKDVTTIILDESHKKPIAVGITIMNLLNLQGKGKAIRNLHYVGDKVWRAIKEL